ncbi:protein of unknown function UPF0086 [Carpediemonas membranifera]|uniref:Uncharacterized protein n=1 Tax=Carpediemonas membranifera TaxID=201153 RepID=A0A8J6E4Q3_9EUKA|nr:protein of unknown function UPF0086 [Carpediemonas membranifera]|eukprot:KAG9397478.1 protein of unknown function UPF0086 [Carpediemonas membranifera]
MTKRITFVIATLLVICCAFGSVKLFSAATERAERFIEYNHPYGISDNEWMDPSTKSQSSSRIKALLDSVTGSAPTIEDPMVIPFGKFQHYYGWYNSSSPRVDAQGNPKTFSSGSRLQRAYKWVFGKLATQKAEFIMYPYEFTHNDVYDSDKHYLQYGDRTLEKGAIVRTNAEAVPWKGYFNWMSETGESVEIELAKAIYEGHVAVLKIQEAVSGIGSRDLTYESSYYCTAMKTYLGKYTQCFDTTTYEKYLNSTTATIQDTSFVYVDQADVQSGWLSQEHNSAPVAVLVIPDVIMRMESTIVDYIGESGKAQIQAFVNNGGTIIASGKGAYVAEKLGLLSSGTVKPREVLVASGNTAYINGCSGPNTLGDRNFYHAAACMGILEDSKERLPQYLLSSYAINPAKDAKLKQYMKFDTTNLQIKDPNEGISIAAKNSDNLFMYGRKEYGNGQIFVNLAHPVARFDAMYPVFLNTIMMSFAKNVLYNSYCEHGMVSDRVSKNYFPALEADIYLKVTSEFMNLYEEPVDDVNIIMQFPRYFDVASVPAGCVNVSVVPHDFMDNDDSITWLSAYSCPVATLPASDVLSLEFTLYINDAKATQRGWNVVVAASQVSYTNTHGVHVQLRHGATYLQAKSAALIRADYNIDPSSFYPLPGKGYTIDPIVTANNRANTRAYDVQHVQVIPLVSPVVDGSDQQVTADILDFWNAYYKKSPAMGTGNGRTNYVYPFSKDYTRGTQWQDLDADHLDVALMSGKAVTLTVEWDDPVKITHSYRDNPKYELAFPPLAYGVNGTKADITNIGALVDLNSTYEVIDQVSYYDYATKFEAAQQRYVPFIDATKEVGATTLWGTDHTAWPTINDEANRPIFNERRYLEEGVITGRRTLGLTRTDLYFMNGDYYENFGRQYLPRGTPSAYTFYTVDKHASLVDPNMPRYEIDFDADFGVTPTADEYVKGYWDSAKDDGLKPTQYYNGLAQFTAPNDTAQCSKANVTNCYRKMIHYDDLELPTGDIRDINNVTATHYLMPINQADVRDERDVRYFDGVTNSDFTKRQGGYYISADGVEYPSVSVINAYQAEFTIMPSYTFRGGKFVFTLPPGVGWGDMTETQILNANMVNFAVDHVAMTDTDITVPADKVNGKWIITAHFRRGTTSGDRYSINGSPIQVALEGLVNSNGQYLARLMDDDVQHIGNYTHEAFNATLAVYDLKYNLAASSVELIDEFSLVDPETVGFTKVEFGVTTLMSLPAVQLSFLFERCSTSTGDAGCPESDFVRTVKAYESIEQFSRYRLYYQDMNEHSTLWGSVETHHVSDPGHVSKSAGFGAVSTIGTSSIPLREYLTTGISQVIPLAATTGRIEWTDLWYRKMAQPLRSAFADVPPIPPPLRNFMISTTFEMLDAETGERYVDAWPTDHAIDVKVMSKFTSNYPKYFDMARCGENHHNAWGDMGGRGLVYDENTTVWTQDRFDLDSPTEATDYSYEKQVFWSKYGECWSEPGTVLEGTLLDSEELKSVNSTTLCSNDLTVSECQDGVTLPTKTLSRADSTHSGKDWQYSPRVADWYPDNYSKANMWDMTHYDYSSTPYAQGYPYTIDNLLPNANNGIYKPHNIVSWPIWKGVGFSVTYDSARNNPAYPVTDPRFSHMSGWWSDNLQSRDDTMLGGQSYVNTYSVGQSPLIPDDEWIDLFDITDSEGNLPTVISNRLKNYYVCLFNRKVPSMHNATRVQELRSVGMNNVVPVAYRPGSNWYNNYACDPSTEMYTPTTISNFTQNYISTNQARDWMYFALTMRGGAHETLTAYLHMEPIDGVSYEGDVKVFDGARFQYWNPVNGPNSFIIVDEETSVTQGIRSDVTIVDSVIPDVVATTDTRFYHVMNLKDAQEMTRGLSGRQYTMQVSPLQYGYGDMTTISYAGELGTSCILQPNQSFTARVTIKNNVGWDIYVLNDGMDIPSVCKNPEARNVDTDKLLADNVYCNYIKNVTAYNFMNVSVDPEIAQYLEIKPSTAVQDMQPLFFDFEHVNAVTIRDGFKGTYYYDIKVLDTFPEQFRGRLYSINVTLNLEQLQGLPNDTDVSGLGDHHAYGADLRVPPIMFGVPYNNTGAGEPDADLAAQMNEVHGKVFYTLGHSSDLKATFRAPSSIDMVDGKFMTSAQVERLTKLVTTDYARADDDMEAYYLSVKDAVNVTAAALQPTSVDSAGWASYAIDFTNAFDSSSFNGGNLDYFPMPRAHYGLPDLADMYLVLRCHRETSPWGDIPAIADLKLTYTDWVGQDKVAWDTIGQGIERTVEAKGAAIDSTFESVLVDPTTLVALEDQRLVWKGKNVVRITARLTNSGDVQAFDARGNFLVTEDFTVDSDSTEFTTDVDTLGDNRKNVTLTSNTDISPGDTFVFTFYLTLDATPRNVTTSNDTAATTGAHGDEVAALGIGDKITAMNEAYSQYRIDSGASLYTQNLNVTTGSTTFTFGGTTSNDTVDVTIDQIDTGVISVAAAATSPDIQYMFQRRIDKTVWETLDTTYEHAMTYDMGGLTAFVEFRVMSVRTYDENIGPQMVGLSDTKSIFIEGSSPIFKRVLLYVVYFATFFIGCIFAFVREGTATFWEALETKPANNPVYSPEDVHDKADIAVAGVFNQRFFETGEAYNVKRLRNAKYEVAGHKFKVRMKRNRVYVRDADDKTLVKLDDYISRLELPRVRDLPANLRALMQQDVMPDDAKAFV